MRRVETSVTIDPAMLTRGINPPDGRRYWLYEEMLPQDRNHRVKPTFKITEVAKVFFFRSADWLRWLDRLDKEEPVFELDGNPLTIQRTEKGGSRIYTLVDVERLAHALLQHAKIDGSQFELAIGILLRMAIGYRMLDEEDLTPPPAPVRIGGRQEPIPHIDEQIERASRID